MKLKLLLLLVSCVLVVAFSQISPVNESKHGGTATPILSTIIYSGGSCNTDSDCYKSCLPGGPGATGGYTGTCEGLPTSCYKDGTLIEPALTSECYVPPADVKFDPPSIIK